MGLISFLLLVFLSMSSTFGQDGDCTVYDTGSGHCAESNCGACKNPRARPGVLCNKGGENQGYYCPPDLPHPNMAYACMDWSSGSVAMTTAEDAYAARTGQSVYFGVGTYGTGDDVQRGLGACYLIHVNTVDRPLLAQSINTGPDVSGLQFDLQQGAGGFGAYNTCAGGDESMFPGSKDPWGKIYGGVDNKAECAGLPPYPKIDGPMKEAGDTLVDLCEISFDRGYRYEGGENPSILEISRVECPQELVEFTWMKRTDDPPFDRPILLHKNVEEHQCMLPESGDWCLTRMMDCRKPSGGWPDNMKPDIMEDGKKIVQPCLADGYTRYDVQCGCSDCYC